MIQIENKVRIGPPWAAWSKDARYKINCRSAGTKLVRFAKRIFEMVPLSFEGAIAIPLLIWVAVELGINRQDRVVLSLAIIGLGWICLAMLLATAAAISVWLWASHSASKSASLVVGESAFTGLRLSRFPWGIGLQINAEWVNAADVVVSLVPDGMSFFERVIPKSRTVLERIDRRIHITDQFGFASVSVRVVTDQHLVVLPDVVSLYEQPQVAVEYPMDVVPHWTGQAEGDLADYRRYAAGDPLKRIVWKAYARTRQVIVRTPEKAETPANKVHVYFVSGPGDEATATVARGWLECHSSDEFLFAADGTIVPVSTVSESLESLARSASFRDRGAIDLETFLKATAAQRAGFVLFLPAQPGPWMGHVMRHLASSHGSCQLIIGLDTDDDRSPSFACRLLQKRRTTSNGKNHIREVCERMKATGAAVCVIDRHTGCKLGVV